MKNELKTQVFFETRMLLIKQQKHVAINNLFNHTFYETNFEPKLFTANVECNGTVIKLPKTD